MTDTKQSRWYMPRLEAVHIEFEELPLDFEKLLVGRGNDLWDKGGKQ